ncbi:type II secretion system inner membrane protein GspF [bacterium]|nr:type II secretion system inner membrane protein GspF [bacterium]
MPQFIYKAKDKKGASVEGVIEAEARSAVITRLQQMGYFPVSIESGQRKGGKIVSTESKPSRSRTSVSKIAPKPKEKAASGGGMSFRRKKVKTADVASFNRQMADLLGAGIALVKALTILGKQTENEELREIILEINSDVQGGATFADALARHPKIFSKLYVAMVRSGEAGGMLDEVLLRLADFSEQEEQLKGRIKSALAYPVVMIVAGGGAVFVMFAYVVPKIVATFRELNQTLPMMTQILIKISDFASHYWWAVISALILLAGGFWRFTHSDEGRVLWHRLQLKIPVLGDLVQKREVARFTRTLGSLLKNGVSILTALGITREVVNNTLVQQEVDKVIEEITQGAGIARPLKDSAIFPPVTVNMMAVGEETGQLESVLLRISDSYELEVDRRVKTLTSLIEPLIIVVMGLIVGFIVISMLLPIFTLDPSGATG